ncbi:MAG: hypothetical protein ACLQD8_06870 [Thermoplasmata archaeon]
MVDLPLTVGALVGILLSGGFVYWEVGRFAEPQVPVTLFDERREIFAYTAGLFVGVPLAVAYVLYLYELTTFHALLGAVALLVALVAATEIAQILLLRSRFWAGSARPFYALGFRAAIGGILSLAAIVAAYLFGSIAPGWPLATVAVSAVALVALEVAGALLSLRSDPSTRRGGGSPWSGALVGGIGFFLLGLAQLDRGPEGLAAAVVALFGATVVYYRLRPLLDRVGVAAPGPAPSRPDGPSAYGRTERSLPEGPETGRRP